MHFIKVVDFCHCSASRLLCIGKPRRCDWLWINLLNFDETWLRLIVSEQTLFELLLPFSKSFQILLCCYVKLTSIKIRVFAWHFSQRAKSYLRRHYYFLVRTCSNAVLASLILFSTTATYMNWPEHSNLFIYLHLKRRWIGVAHFPCIVFSKLKIQSLLCWCEWRIFSKSERWSSIGLLLQRWWFKNVFLVNTTRTLSVFGCRSCIFLHFL